MYMSGSIANHYINEDDRFVIKRKVPQNNHEETKYEHYSNQYSKNKILKNVTVLPDHKRQKTDV